MSMLKINRAEIAFLTLFFIFFSALTAESGTEKTPGGTSPAGVKIRILILSKHIRLLKENKRGSIDCILPESGELETVSGRIRCTKVSIISDGVAFSIKTRNNIYSSGELTLFPVELDETFIVYINGEKRIYPLPLFIKFSENGIELSIEEKINRFAIDSAYAEFGNITEKQSEALYALAHLIKARCMLPYPVDKHKGYQFCDLTCCQAYKGRTAKDFNDPVYIRTEGITGGFFFHSSSGGLLFTESIFNSGVKHSVPPKDFIYSENLTLSRNRYSHWEAHIDKNELARILYPSGNIFLKNILFDREKEITVIETGTGSEIIPPETLRIKVNRIKGWNFLKSNNYMISENNGVCEFAGSGMGHGVGMSLEGALQLAEKGYSRYEILEHYYPAIEYKTTSPTAVNHQLQYTMFNYSSGETVQGSSGDSFRNRRIPCGSVFKLFIALYLAEQKPDIFYNYTYTCKGNTPVKNLMVDCWKKDGHGRLNISSALYNSCNRYFASLHKIIDYEDFKKWIEHFTIENGIDLDMAEIKDKKNFSLLLAGLDFNVTISVNGLIKLNRYIFLESTAHSSDKIEIIFNALHKTFIEGTAKMADTGHYPLNCRDMWGKTGTVIAGTNSHCGYGIFTGGTGSTGIVAILRKGTGAKTALESEKILLQHNTAPFAGK